MSAHDGGHWKERPGYGQLLHWTLLKHIIGKTLRNCRLVTVRQPASSTIPSTKTLAYKSIRHWFDGFFQVSLMLQKNFFGFDGNMLKGSTSSLDIRLIRNPWNLSRTNTSNFLFPSFYSPDLCTNGPKSQSNAAIHSEVKNYVYSSLLKLSLEWS